MNAPLVTVVIPVFNAADFVLQAIGSVLSQSIAEIELVVVNDGSTDDSVELIATVSDPRLRLVSQCNAGQSAAINRGVEESHGQFIKLVDADDWINPQHIESQLKSLDGHPECVSGCRWGYFRDDFRHPTIQPEFTNRDYEDPLAWITDSLTQDEGMMGGWKWLIPRQIWDRSGGYDIRLSLNNDFHASIAILLASAGVRFAPDAVYSYRKGVGSALSGTRSRRSMESALLTTQLGCELLLNRENSPRIRKLCAERFQRWAYDFYPEHEDLTAAAEQAAVALGGACVPFPGGSAGRAFATLIGWKNARQLQRFAHRLGWRRVQHLKKRLRERRLK